MAKTVSVTLTAAVDGYIANINKAAAATQSFASKSAGHIAKNDASLSKLANGAGIAGGALALGLGAAVKAAADFDQAMSNVSATGQDAKSNLQALRDAAIDAGAKTSFSATEAAAGIENLAKAGVSAKDTLGGGLKGSLDLAAAGGIGVAQAAETAATAMTQFKLSGQDVPHIADLLAAGAGKAQGEVSDMAQALNQSGLVAAQFGLSIEETTGTLAAFASAGLLGSDAGTSMKTMLLRLANPSKEAATALKDLGVNAYDAQGQFVGMESLAGQLQKGLSKYSAEQRDAALSTIFGSDAIRAANVLYTQGAGGIKQWTANVNDAGFAARTAAEKMNNLKGDIEGFKGSLETALIGLGAGGQGPLRDLVQGATDAVNAFNGLPDSVKQGTLVVGTVAAAALLGAAGLIKLVQGAVATQAALASIASVSPAAAAGMSRLALAAGPAAVALLAVAAANSALDNLGTQAKGANELEAALFGISEGQVAANEAFTGGNWADELQALLSGGVSPAQDLKSAIVGVTAAQDTWIGKVMSWKEAITPGTQSIEKAKDQLTNLDTALTSMVSKGNEAGAAEAVKRLGLSYQQVNKLLPQYASSLQDATAATEASFRASERAFTNGGSVAGMNKATVAARDYSAAIDLASTALSAIDPSIKRTAEQSSQLAGSLFAQGDAFQNTMSASSAYQQSIDDANKVLDENGKYLNKSKTALSDTSAKGRENIGVLNSLASSGKAYVQSLIQQGTGADKAAAATRKVRSEFVAAARDAGLTEGQAKKLADSYGLIPSKVSTTVEAFGLAIQAQKVKEFEAALNALPPEQKARIISIFEKKGAVEAQNALARLKDKNVIARSKAVGTKDVKGLDSAMKALKDRRVEAKARGDKKEVVALDKAIKALHDKQVTAKANAEGEAGVRRLVGAVGALHNKTVNVVTHYSSTGSSKQAHNSGSGGGSPKGATGGLFTGSRFRYSDGGPVFGAGTATSDSIPALLSNGEFVLKAASAASIGIDRLLHMNRTGSLPGFAAGGIVGAATGYGVDQALILRLVSALATPLTAITAATRALEAARSVKGREDRETRAALAAYKRAIAVDKRKNTKGSEAAKDKAEVAYKKQLDQQRDANAKLADTTRALADANNAAADSARSMSDQFSKAFRSGSVDPKDWLEAMLGGSAELTKFTAQIGSLRKAGLDESLIQQIIEQGAVTGGETAANILAGGKGLVSQLNSANKSLEKAADALGYLGTTSPQRKALGGPVVGAGTGTSDSIAARLSNGEYVVPAHAVGANRAYLDSITYGRNVVAPVRFAQTHYARGGYVNTGPLGVDTAAIAAAVEAGLSNASFTGYIDGGPVRMIVTAELRDRGRANNRTR